MKKIYISALFASVGIVSFGQYAQKGLMSTSQLATQVPKEITQVTEEKALGVAVWGSDFSTPSDWTINNSGQTGAAFGWTINAVRDGWFGPTTGIASTSGGNYAELSNGNPTLNPPTQATNVVYTLTTAAPISLTTSGTKVSLEFLQFGARFNDLQEIRISTNGTTFTPVGNNLDIPVLSASDGAAYQNPSKKIINLAPFLTGATQVWIQFRWTTNVPSLSTNPNVWIAYGWFIDDVKVTTNPGFDLSVVNNYWGSVGLNYSNIPLAQVAPISFAAKVFNGGINPMTKSKLNVNITGTATFSTASAPVTIASLASDSLVATGSFTPSALGTYTVARTITADSIDDVPSNNTFSPINFAVTNNIYARDFGTPSGKTSNGTDGFEVGNLFDIFQTKTLSAVNMRLATGSVVGTEIYARIYEDIPNEDPVFVGESNPFFITAAMINTEKTVLLNSAVTLTAGKTYLAVIGTDAAGLIVANAGTSSPGTTLIFDKGALPAPTWYYQTPTVYVRLNFGPTLGVEENSAISSVGTIYPNPTSGETILNFTLKNAVSVGVSVVDITGKEVYSTTTNRNEGVNNLTIDATSLAKGAYYVTLSAEGTSVTKKLIKQ